MPLSEHEQRLLEQIERALYADDPKFASTVRANDLRTHRRKRLGRAAVMFAVGLVVLVVGVAIQQLLVALLGGAAMLWGILRGSTAVRGRAKAAPQSSRRASKRSSLKDRAEERWRKRFDERDS